MKKYAILFFTTMIWLSAYSFPNYGRITFTVCAIDEDEKQPVENVPIKAVFSDNPVRWGDEGSSRTKSGRTNSKGFCRFTGLSNCGSAGYVVEKTPGFYETPFVRYTATNEFSSLLPLPPYRCEPYDCVFTTLLQRVKHPIPLYVRNVDLGNQLKGMEGFDGTNLVLKFDFVKGDWLPPHGNGKYTDMIINSTYRITDRVKRDRYITVTFYEFTNTIEFTGEGNGLVEKSFENLNYGIKFRTAPEAGYVGEKVLRFGRRRDKTAIVGVHTDDYSESDRNRCYCFRIRSQFDEKGNLIRAYYGKIYGDFNFTGSKNVGLCGISFLYYLNPTSLDRNLEWDRKTNLCPNPGGFVGDQP